MSSCIHCFEFGPYLEEAAEWSGTLHMLMKGPDTQGKQDQDHWESRTRVGSIEVDYQTELQQLVTRVFIQVQSVVRIGVI